MSFDLGLQGRRAVVTGGTKGVGAAVVEVLHKAGMTVIASARSVPDTAPQGVSYFAADLTTAEGCETLTRAVINRIGGVDAIINVLGGSSAPSGGFAALSDDEWAAALNQNLMPAVRIDRALLPSMI